MPPRSRYENHQRQHEPPLEQGAGRREKISPLVKPSTMAVREVDGDGRTPDDEGLGATANGHGQRKTPMDTRGSEVDVWV
jgi:hypothetical protein